MAIVTYIEKLGGSLSAPTLPVLVVEDTGAVLELGDALSAAGSAIPPDIFGLQPTDDPDIVQESQTAYRITARYGQIPIGIIAGTERGNHNANAETLENVQWAQPIDRFPPAAVNFQGTIITDGERLGANIRPGFESTGKSVRLNIVQFTPAVLRACTIWARSGVVNSVPCAGYAAGELQFVTFRAQQDTQTTYQCYFGWSGKPNVTGLTIGEVGGVSYQGHDHIYANTRRFVDRNNATLGRVASSVHVVRPWPRADLNALPVTPDPIA